MGFGTEDVPRALAIAGGIALQNLPEGMVLIAPMLQAGIPPRRTLALAVSTGAVEIVGTLLGYGTVSLSAAALPFLLAFAGGAMLYLCLLYTSLHGGNAAAGLWRDHPLAARDQSEKIKSNEPPHWAVLFACGSQLRKPLSLIPI